MALFYRTGVIADGRSFTLGDWDFRFCPCDLGPDPMTFVYEPDLYSLEIYRMNKYELTYVKTFQSYRQTDRHKIIYHSASRVVKGLNNYM